MKPDRRRVRQMIDEVLSTDDEFEVFCIDMFPNIHREFGTAMNRTARINILLERHEDASYIANKLYEFNSNANIWQDYVVAPMSSPDSFYNSSWYISRSEIEYRAMSLLQRPGAPVVLWGSERCGKTWLLRQLINNVQKEDGSSARIAFIHLDEIIRGNPADSNQFFRAFGLHLIDAFDNADDWVVEWPRWLNEAWEQIGGPMRKLKWLVQQRLLPQCPSRLIIAIDGADAVVGSGYQNDFYGMLRGWSEGSLSSPFDRLRIIMAVSYAPNLLIEEIRQSPFNLTQPLIVDEFSPEQLHELSWRYALFWSLKEIRQLSELVGGHPYLARLVMHRLSQDKSALSTILNLDSQKSKELFAPFLSRYRQILDREISLRTVLRQIDSGEIIARNTELTHRLERAGLVVRDNEHSRLRLRCSLYKTLL